MKFEDFLMLPSEENQRRHNLEEEVAKLKEELKLQQKLNAALQCTRQPVLSRHCLSAVLPLQVQVLLAELAMVEEEILWLEKTVEKLKLSSHKERKYKQWEAKQLPHRQQTHYLYKRANKMELDGPKQHSGASCDRHIRKFKVKSQQQNFPILCSSASTEEAAEKLRRYGDTIQSQRNLDKGRIQNPNDLSEELIKSLICIYLRLNQATPEHDGSENIPKLTISCMNSKGFKAKTPFNCKAPAVFSGDSTPNPDPYCIFTDYDGTTRDVGPYKNFIQITRSSLNSAHVAECFPAIENLRTLMLKLCDVDLTYLTYKQKLAFWINVYNGCIMHAFLQHGLPSTQEKLLALMNKAVLNVGGIILNALAIEHFILRHPYDSDPGPANEKEMLLRHAYGLGYPEPNVTFALCRGSWSSPALRIYTPDEVVNELERAKVDYLEASVGITTKKKIILPKLLRWHMRDFADDMNSLLEWIYSQLSHSGSLKKLMIECVNGGTKCPTAKMVEIQPYESEFRYLMPSRTQ